MMPPIRAIAIATPDELILELLPIAAEMGLRGVNPEGLVWTSHVPQQRSVIERNVVWIAGIACRSLPFSWTDFPRSPAAQTAQANRLQRPTRQCQSGGQTDEVDGARHAHSAAGNQRKQRAAGSCSREWRRGCQGIHREGCWRDRPIDFPPMEPEMAFDPLTGSLQSGAGGSTARIDTPTPSVKPEKPATAPPMPDTPSSVAANTNKPKSSPIAADDSADPAPEISISDGGEVPIPYITLEAAVADAKDGGAVGSRSSTGSGPFPKSRSASRANG